MRTRHKRLLDRGYKDLVSTESRPTTYDRTWGEASGKLKLNQTQTFYSSMSLKSMSASCASLAAAPPLSLPSPLVVVAVGHWLIPRLVVLVGDHRSWLLSSSSPLLLLLLLSVIAVTVTERNWDRLTPLLYVNSPASIYIVNPISKVTMGEFDSSSIICVEHTHLDDTLAGDSARSRTTWDIFSLNTESERCWSLMNDIVAVLEVLVSEVETRPKAVPVS